MPKEASLDIELHGDDDSLVVSPSKEVKNSLKDKKKKGEKKKRRKEEEEGKEKKREKQSKKQERDGLDDNRRCDTLNCNDHRSYGENIANKVSFIIEKMGTKATTLMTTTKKKKKKSQKKKKTHIKD